MDSNDTVHTKEIIVNETQTKTDIGDINGNIAEKPQNAEAEWKLTSVFSKLTQLRNCLAHIQDNSRAIQNYITTTAQNFFLHPKNHSGTTSPFVALSKNRIALERVVKNLGHTNTILANTAFLASPTLSYYSLKTADSNDYIVDTVCKTYKDSNSIADRQSTEDKYMDPTVPSDPISLTNGDNGTAGRNPNLTRSGNRSDSHSKSKNKKGCCNCFGFKKKKSTNASSTNKEDSEAGTSDTMNETKGSQQPLVGQPVSNNFTPVNQLAQTRSRPIENSTTTGAKVEISVSKSTEKSVHGGPLFSPITVRRTRVADRPNIPISLWSILKNFLGKDITKMPLPVNFSEPLSMLQRLTEDYEYSDILNIASHISDSCEQMVHVAAFTVSSYATTTVRTNKPFNPLLGETYECDRSKDLGWRCINEKVVHHPPCIAQHCEGKSWTCWQQFSMTSRFHTNALHVIPLGTSHLKFTASGDSSNHYTWRKVTTIVHNIMLGKLWVGQEGEMTVVNHGDGTTCRLTYLPPSGGNDAPKKVVGEVLNKKGELKWKLTGLWDTYVEACEVVQISPEILGPIRRLWTRKLPPPEAEKYYNLTELACQLNELENGIAPTDSRLRPDQRYMENGLWDEANAEKRRLEEKQRVSRRRYSSDSKTNVDNVEPGWTPMWFYHVTDPTTGLSIHIYNGEYWSCKDKQDWDRCPNIFSNP